MEQSELYREGAQALWDMGVKQIPQKYIQAYDHPRVCEPHLPIPIIDLSKLQVPKEHAAPAAAGDAVAVRNEVLQELRSACQSWGFFILINHGFSQTLMSNMTEVIRQFFELPLDVKMSFLDSGLGSCKTRYGVTFPGSSDWRDYVVHPWLTLSDIDVPGIWPDLPPRYREIATEYSKNMRDLSLRLLALLSESLGMRESFLIDIFKDHLQKMLVNNYPPCPQPHLALGVSAHTDPNGITILQQDDVGGLEILKDGCWHAVDPVPNAFVVNIGDALEIITNGRYKSVEHRAMVNSKEYRHSIVTFCGPSYDAMIGPSAELIKQEDSSRRVYKEVSYGEYLTQFYSEGLKGKHYINSLKIHKNM